MYQLIFRNWKFALLWAVGLTASAAAFMESGGGHERLEASAKQIRAQKALVASQAAPSGAAAPARVDPLAEPPAEEEAEAGTEPSLPPDAGEPAAPRETADNPA